MSDAMKLPLNSGRINPKKAKENGTHGRVAACASTKHGGSHRAPAQNTLREAQHARAARKSLQAQLAAGGGPGVGARSPSPPGTASTASGAEGARHQRAHGGRLRAPAQNHLREAQHARGSAQKPASSACRG